MNVGSICQRELDLAESRESTVVAAQRMDARQVGTLVVTDGSRRPVGIVTDRDLAVRVLGQRRDPEATTVADVMTAHARTVDEDAQLETALEIMRDVGVRRLPVVGDGGALVGVISLDDILIRMADTFGELGALLARSGPRGLAVT